MSGDNKTSGDPKDNKQDGIITELHIPPELIEDHTPSFKQNRSPYLGALSIIRAVALLSWIVAVLAICLRLNDSARDYSFAQILGGGVPQQDEGALRGFVLVSAGALALSGISCCVGAILCATKAALKSTSGRFLLILSVLSILMAAVLYFFW